MYLLMTLKHFILIICFTYYSDFLIWKKHVCEEKTGTKRYRQNIRLHFRELILYFRNIKCSFKNEQKSLE